MLEFLTATGLATAAGLNAYMPLVIIGALGKWTSFITLPDAWSWLTEPWALVLFGGLLIFELVADKIPAVDTVNDLVSTVIRPAAGGVVFSAGVGMQTPAVSNPSSLLDSSFISPLVIGIVMALITHGFKALTRMVLNAATFGLAAPAISAAEDGTSVLLILAAILVPVLVVVVLVVGMVLLMRVRRRRRTQAEAIAAEDLTAATPAHAPIPPGAV